jgi:hypothetical protein
MLPCLVFHCRDLLGSCLWFYLPHASHFVSKKHTARPEELTTSRFIVKIYPYSRNRWGCMLACLHTLRYDSADATPSTLLGIPMIVLMIVRSHSHTSIAPDLLPAWLSFAATDEVLEIVSSFDKTLEISAYIVTRCCSYLRSSVCFSSRKRQAVDISQNGHRKVSRR